MSSLQLKAWMKLATTQEQCQLARDAGTTRQMLYSFTVLPISPKYRRPSADLAGRLEQAAKPLAEAAKGRLPPLTRGDLCYACAACTYFNRDRS